jgi:hypothetical protein
MHAAPRRMEDLFNRSYRTSLPGVALASVASAIETLLSHRSMWKYDARPAPGGTLELLIAAAQSGGE